LSRVLSLKSNQPFRFNIDDIPSFVIPRVRSVIPTEGEAGLSIPLRKLHATATGSCRFDQDDLPVVKVA
jgi:hypothetical protein